jgi:3'(2'), 5'-bisphosphate nucleotidase
MTLERHGRHSNAGALEREKFILGAQTKVWTPELVLSESKIYLVTQKNGVKMLIQAQTIINIAKHAGDNILMPNWGQVARKTKGDGSPVTIVDKQVSDYVIDQLKALTPDIPVISEEATVKENEKAMVSSLRWVIDPLDGTSTYLDGPSRGKEAGFGVHIALIDNGNSVRGFVYFPAQKRVYYTGDDGNAYVQIGDEKPTQIHARQELESSKIQAAVPWKESKRPEAVNGHPYEPVLAVGGEEICKVAHGEADLIWHDRPDKQQPLQERDVFSHWDVAAAHAVLKAAGGNLYEMATGIQVEYDQTSFHVPPCVAGHADLLKQIGFTPEGNGNNHTPDLTL